MLRCVDGYPMTDEDREIQETARRFVDEELIPHEVEAEMAGGRISDELRERHHRMAIELGLYSMNMPKELGGGGMTMFQQVLVSEQIGRVTNALGWCVHTPPAWAPAVVSKEQLERWILPSIRGEMHECYAITEEGAGSDVDAIEATARRDGDGYVLNGTKMHVTSFNMAAYCFFQAKIVGGPNDGRARDVLRRQGHAGRAPGARARVHAHVPRHPRDRRLRGRPRARHQPRRRGGRRARVHVRVVPLRALDDRRALLRRRGAPHRGGDRLREGARAVRAADRELPGDPAHAGRLAHRAVGRAPHDLPPRTRSTTAST